MPRMGWLTLIVAVFCCLAGQDHHCWWELGETCSLVVVGWLDGERLSTENRVLRSGVGRPEPTLILTPPLLHSARAMALRHYCPISTGVRGSDTPWRPSQACHNKHRQPHLSPLKAQLHPLPFSTPWFYLCCRRSGLWTADFPSDPTLLLSHA